MVIETKKYIYLIEFKIRASAHDALQQIIDKKYAQKYSLCSKSITLIGIAFDIEKRNIVDWVIQGQ